MADSAPFEWLCGELERATSLDRLATRGTVRLALKQAGLESWNVTAGQLAVVLQKSLPAALAARAVADGEALCRAMAARLSAVGADPAAAAAPEDLFRRLERR